MGSLERTIEIMNTQPELVEGLIAHTLLPEKPIPVFDTVQQKRLNELDALIGKLEEETAIVTPFDRQQQFELSLKPVALSDE